MNTESSPLEEIITSETPLLEALHAMKPYRNWSDNTFESYLRDIQQFETYWFSKNITPTLGNIKLHLVNQWVKHLQEKKAAAGTIKRRIAALSSMYTFYVNLGIINSNPFLAVESPVGASDYASALMEINEVRQVYHAVDVLKREGVDIEITTKVMFFSGLRNDALCRLNVSDVLFDHGLLKVDAGIINSKHKVQFLPLPPKLLELLKNHIHTHGLTMEDTLLFGLSGLPLREKALNRLTEKINRTLGWMGEKRVTPHGFRSSVATLLSERGVDIKAIKFVLGHSDQDLQFGQSVWIYIRKHRRWIEQIRLHLTQIEEELDQQNQNEPMACQEEPAEANTEKREMPVLGEQLLIQLFQQHPELALAMLQNQLLKKPQMSS